MQKVAPALLAAALLAVPAARAQGTAPAPAAPAVQPQMSRHFIAAQRLYQKLDLDAALAELKDAEEQAKDNEDEIVQILVYRGLIMADLGKHQEMTALFKRALAIRPWAEVPPESSPRVLKAFADARSSLWGTGSSVKPPVKRTVAVPVSTTESAPQAVPATATETPQAVPATATEPAPPVPATATEPPPPVPVPAAETSAPAPAPAADTATKDLAPPK